MDDYDHILSSDFPLPPDADTTLPDADPEADVDGDGVEDSGEFLPEVLEDEVSPSNAKGKAVTQGMNEEERKERQKLQNRKAAERSRHKKRQEQCVVVPLLLSTIS